MSRNALYELFATSKRYVCAKGQILVQPDEEPRGVYYIRSGYVKACDFTRQGESQLITITGPGSVLPLYWMMETDYFQLFYQSMTDVEYSVMETARFNESLKRDDRLREELTELLQTYYIFSQLRIQNLEYKTVLERVAFRLLLLGDYFGHKEGQSVCIDIPLTHQDIADSLNMTRDTANRSIRELIRRGMLRRAERKFIIPDSEELKELLVADGVLER